MSGDFSRSTFDPRKHYAGVRMQQGRVQLDADWNEQVDIVDHAARARTLDLVGWSGGPDVAAGFGLTVESALVFQGEGDLVEAPSREEYALRVHERVTVEAVVTPRAGGAGGPIVSAGDLLLRLEHGRLSFRHGGATVTTRPLAGEGPVHVVAVYDGETLRIHAGGKELEGTHAVAGADEPEIEIVEAAAVITAGDAVVQLSSKPHPHRGEVLRIGAARGQPKTSFDGVIRRVRIWRDALPAAEIPALPSRPFDDDPLLLASFRLDEGAGHVVRDRSPLRNDAHLTGPEGRRPRWRCDDLRIGAGRYYVGGVLCANESPVSFAAQPDLPGEPLPDAPGVYLAMLDVWERLVGALEDPSLLEPALGGVDTAARTKTVWQVRLLPVAGETSHPDAESALAELTAPSGKLRGKLADGARVPGNRLYRVEIHDDGEVFGSPLSAHGEWLEVTADPRAPTVIEPQWTHVDPARWRVGRWVELTGRGDPLLTRLVGVDTKARRLTLADPVRAGAGRLRMRRIASYKWSRNNGLDALPVTPSAPAPPLPAARDVSLAQPVGTRSTRLSAGEWVEVEGDREILRGDPGPLGKIDKISYDGYTLTLQDALPAGAGQGSHPCVRRWDGAPGPSASPLQPARAGWAELESGIQVQLTGSGPYRPGHHWLLPVRVQSDDLDWPRDAEGPVARAPLGDHLFARVALVRVDHDGVRVEDLRSTFVPLADLRTPGAELVGPITIRGELRVEGEARALLLAGPLRDGAVEARELADDAVTAHKLAPHAVHARNLSEGIGFVPEGFAILGGSPVPPPGFAYAHRQIEVKDPAPAWAPQPALPGPGGRVVLVTVGEALYALHDHPDVAIYRRDDAEKRWVEVGKRHAHRVGFGAAAVGDTIHIVGGLDEHGLARADHEVFDTVEGGVAKPAYGKLRRARARLGVAAIDGLVYAVGGVEGLLPWRVRDFFISLGMPPRWFHPGRSSDAVEVHDGKRWHTLPSMPTARSDFALAVLHGRLHVLGGRGSGLFGSHVLREHEDFMPSRRRWRVRTPLATRRAEAGAAVVRGELYAVGGRGPDREPLDTVDAYLASSDAWHPSASLLTARYDHGTAALFGEVHVVAGHHKKAPLHSGESCAMASTLFVHRKLATAAEGARAEPGEAVGAEAQAPRPVPAAHPHRHHAVLDPPALPSAEAVQRALLLLAVLALVAVLVYGYSPGPPSPAPAPPNATAPHRPARPPPAP
jgi:Family of unknown function (DUF6519)/Kelch motif